MAPPSAFVTHPFWRRYSDDPLFDRDLAVGTGKKRRPVPGCTISATTVRNPILTPPAPTAQDHHCQMTCQRDARPGGTPTRACFAVS